MACSAFKCPSTAAVQPERRLGVCSSLGSALVRTLPRFHARLADRLSAASAAAIVVYDTSESADFPIRDFVLMTVQKL